MNNKLFSRILEIIWLLVSLFSAWACLGSFIHHDRKTGYLMLLCTVVALAVFWVRRRYRLTRKND